MQLPTSFNLLLAFLAAVSAAQNLPQLHNSICSNSGDRPFSVSNGTNSWVVCCSTALANKQEYSAIWLSANNSDGGRTTCCKTTHNSMCQEISPSMGDLDCDRINSTGPYIKVMYGGDQVCQRSIVKPPPLFNHAVGTICAFGTGDQLFSLNGNHYCCEESTRVMAVMPRESGSGWNLKPPYPRCCRDVAATNCSDPRLVSVCALGMQHQVSEWWSWCSKSHLESALTNGTFSGPITKVGVTCLLILMMALYWAFASV